MCDFAFCRPKSFRRIKRRRERLTIREPELALADEELDKTVGNVALVPQLNPFLQMRLGPFAVVAPIAYFTQPKIAIIHKILYLRPIRILRMVPFARIAERIRLYDAHKPSPEPKQVPDAPIGRVRMGRLAMLKTIVLKTVMDLSVRQVRFF